MSTTPGLPADSGQAVPAPGEYVVYGWGWAPAGLATRRQLAALGLTPGRACPRGEIRWSRDRRVAYLYALDDPALRPKRPPTLRQLAALARAERARRTCPACGVVAEYVLPTSLGSCLDCHDHATAAAA